MCVKASSHYNANPETRSSLFPKILSSFDFTYAVFDALAEDFNGDMFPSDGRERRAVTEKHLQLLQRFLLGDAGEQQPLFFWAYRFDIIPVELISSIYEEFYHHETSSADKEDDKGTHYTPGSLVEFTLSQVLTPEKLSKRPRILDPACGSGIFLVEAFRRVVRYHVHDQGGERLDVAFLRSILRDQIAGIEINKEAIRVTAFSLYLALLHYQRPKDILLQINLGHHLPKLIYDDAHPPDADHFNTLLGEDAFRVTFEPEQAVKLPSMEEESTFPFFLRARVDIVVGNPPWGSSDVSDNAFAWCKSRSLPVGDRELSQAFVWKSLDLLAEGGSVGLLVSTGLFFKHAANSVEFRRHWLKVCRLKEVVNFAHVRKVFFPSGTAPFASVVFEKRTTSKRRNAENLVRYWSAKKTAQINKLRAVILSPVDLKRVRQEDLRSDDKLWKIYWWGNDRDRALISWLDQWTRLGDIADEFGARLISGRGFEVTRIAKKPSEWLADYLEFPTNKFARYGPLDPSALRQVPHSVYRRGTEDIYSGERLLIKRGISQTPPPKGMIVARFASERFCFRNSIHGIKLRNGQTWEYKVLLAIFWSSLARYYYFLTSSAWGMWHDELHLEEIERLPVRFPETPELIERIVSLVDSLSSCESSTRHDARQKVLFAVQRSVNTVNTGDLEMELDEAVFDLYELSSPERDQVRDMCQFGLDFFYNDSKSSALSAAEIPGHWIKVTQPDLFSKAAATEASPFVADYIRVFVEAWNRELEATGAVLDWKVIGPENDTGLLAILFGAHSFSGEMKDLQPGRTWSQTLRELEENLLFPHRSRQVFIDGIVRAITPDQMLIIKRNEMRFWTKSAAREDVQALMVQAMNRKLTFEVVDEDVVVNG